MESSRAGVPRVVAVLAGLLERAAERGDAEGTSSAASTSTAPFRGRAVPGIPVRRYAERIYRYAGCSPACFVVAYVYLDRLARRDGDGTESEKAAAGVAIDSFTVHRLLITSVLVAAKFMDDRHNNNAYFARVGGVEVPEMNALELRLLFALRFRLNVHADTFARYCAALECHVLMHHPAVPPPLPSSPVSDDDHQQQVTTTTTNEKGAATAAAAVHNHHHRRVVVQTIMTTSQ